VHLAELHDLDGVDVACRSQHHEQDVAVALQLRSLVGVDGVLDGQAVQAELLGDGLDLLLARAQEADPAEAASPVGAPAELLEGVVERRGDGGTLAVDVDRVVDHGHAGSCRRADYRAVLRVCRCTSGSSSAA
jgi:hypothetical protein